MINSSTNPQELKGLLDRHGELVLRLGSGETWEIHLGDEPQFGEYGVAFKTVDALQFLPYDQIERVEAHRAHQL